ncbi:MAG: type II and III secretion system protein [Candidatus Omnitrophota bacterium]
MATVTLDYYQDIGIQLKVIPQVGVGNDISMVIHPAVTSYTETIGDNKYPVILTREAETRVVMRDGETIVIGGLLVDQKTKGISGIPLLMNIPFLGKLFSRDTVSTDKLDLLIFISAKVVKDGAVFAQEIRRAEEGDAPTSHVRGEQCLP